MRVNLYTFAKLNVLANISKCSDICVLRNSDTFTNKRWLLHPLLGRIHSFCHKGEQLPHSCTSILHTNESSICFAIKSYRLGHEYHASARLRQMREIFGIAKKRELPLVCRLNRSHIRHLAIGITHNLAAKQHGYLLCRKFHITPIL